MSRANYYQSILSVNKLPLRIQKFFSQINHEVSIIESYTFLLNDNQFTNYSLFTKFWLTAWGQQQ